MEVETPMICFSIPKTQLIFHQFSSLRNLPPIGSLIADGPGKMGLFRCFSRQVDVFLACHDGHVNKNTSRILNLVLNNLRHAPQTVQILDISWSSVRKWKHLRQSSYKQIEHDFKSRTDCQPIGGGGGGGGGGSYINAVQL